MEDAKNFGSNIYPVIQNLQLYGSVLRGKNKDISKIILTASGGAFRDISFKIERYYS
ncbi:MAG: hypothetical protein Ct9H90mP2_07860 [Dehalococcoidia bacterium]|nr:MAG: hypothetical protein Ct9H90mP2_07860 [Dehalococcoidia bacterium]